MRIRTHSHSIRSVDFSVTLLANPFVQIIAGIPKEVYLKPPGINIMADQQVLHGVESELSNRRGLFYHVGDGLHYTLVDYNENNASLRCLTTSCPGTALWHGNGLIHRNAHNHLPNPHLPAQLALRRRILERVENADPVSYRNIYEEECSHYPKAVQARIQWKHIYPEMKAARLSLYSQDPQSLQVVAEALQQPPYSVMSATEDGQDNMFSNFVSASSGSGSLICCSTRNASFLSQCSSVVCVTQNVTVNIDLQLLIVVATIGNIALPLVYCLMEEPMLSSYREVLTKLKEMNDKFYPDLVVTPYNMQLKEAWEIVFPNAEVLDQLLHYFIEDLVEQVKTLPVVLEDFRNVFSMCCALPLLPHGCLHEGFKYVVEEATQLNVFEDILPLFNYMWDKWFTGLRYENESISVTSHKLCSSNVSIALINMLKKCNFFLCRNIFFLIGCFAELEGGVTQDICKLQEGQQTASSRKISTLHNLIPLDQLNEKELSFQDYLNAILPSLDSVLEPYFYNR